MIKVFNNTQEYNTYTQGGLVAGDLYYVLENGSVHFRTNNIDGEDKVYDKADEGGTIPTPTYSELTFINGVCENGTISCQDGDCFEIYNPNNGHLWVGVYSSTPSGAPVGYIGDNERFYITCNSMKGFGGVGVNNPNQIVVDIDPMSVDANVFNGIVYYRILN